MINYYNYHLTHKNFSHNPMNGRVDISYILWDNDNNPQKEYVRSWWSLKAIMETWF